MKRYLQIILITIVTLSLIFFTPSISASEWITIDETDFDEGTYTNTHYNNTGTCVELNVSETSGYYTSKIFNASGKAHWNDISWEQSGTFGYENKDDLVLWMHLDDKYGAIVDSSSYGYDGTYNGVLYDQTGKFNTSIGFNGTDDYVDLPLNMEEIGIGNFTLCAWINPSTDSFSRTPVISIVGKETGGNTYYDVAICTDNDRDISLIHKQHSTSHQYYANLPDLWDGNWHFLVGRCSGTAHADHELFLDGEKISTNLGSYNLIENSLGRASNYGRFYKGKVDEVTAWNRSLTDEELLDMYQMGITRLNLSVRTCTDEDCLIDASWNDLGVVSSPYDLSSYNETTYFQYKFGFYSEDSTYTPKLFNVTVNYTFLGINHEPIVTDEIPTNETYNVFLPVSLGVTIADPDADTMDIRFYSNLSGTWEQIGSTVNDVHNGTYYLYAPYFGVYNTKYFWKVLVTDSVGESNETFYAKTFYFVTGNRTSSLCGQIFDIQDNYLYMFLGMFGLFGLLSIAFFNKRNK